MIKLKDLKFDYGFKEGEYLVNAWCLADKFNECVYGEKWDEAEKARKKGKFEEFIKSKDYKMLVTAFKKRALKAIREKVKEFLNKNG